MFLKTILKYIAELIIVVVGVSIAFQLNVWNDTRKNKELEHQLLQNFVPENTSNQAELDSSLTNLKATLTAELELLDMLNNSGTSIDSIRIKMSVLYTISWSDFSTTHLENYLNFTSVPTPLTEEMLTLHGLTSSVRDLIKSYVEQKQQKYFDFLSDAVDMTSGLTVVNEDKLRSVQFRNNVMIISAYEDALIKTYHKMDSSQQSVMRLVTEELSN